MKMSYLIFIAFSLFQLTVQELTAYPVCGTDPGTGRGITLSVNSRRSKTGEWLDTFTARAERSNSSSSIGLDVTHKVTECEGKLLVYVQVVSKVNPSEEKQDKLTFHSRCGKNVAIGDDGRTVEKINLSDRYNSAVFTNRPLKDDELFEVKIEKQNERPDHSMGIGVITRTPNDIEFFPEMYKSPFCWIYHNVNVYTNGTIIFKKYGRSTQDLRVGDSLGVKRNQFGTINFFVNGVDLGPAASNIPSEVYGVFELWGNAPKAVIVDAPSPPSS